MMEIKKGDVVIGNDLATKNYTVVRKGWIGIAVSDPIEAYGEVFINVVQSQNGRVFTVLASCFDLYKEKRNSRTDIW